jgi:hypothetical protein
VIAIIFEKMKELDSLLIAVVLHNWKGEKEGIGKELGSFLLAFFLHIWEGKKRRGGGEGEEKGRMRER